MLENLKQRPRRLRRTQSIRDMVGETSLSLSDLIQPYFLSSDSNPEAKEEIKNFSGVYRLGTDNLSRQLEANMERGLKQFMLFGATPKDQKDAEGSTAYANNNALAETVATLRKRLGKDAVLLTDVCLCPFTSHGHCGLIDSEGAVQNDTSVELLAKMALTHAQAGADFVSPSDMMDGRIGAIRETLDQAGYTETSILAYSAKYRSNYYGPFREALDSAPGKGDRSGYQMDFRNQREALRELSADLDEGADLVMVKPALAYLDIISLFKEASDVPVAAYSVSGEYEMMQLVIREGLAEEQAFILENLTAIRRAGADIILTYFAEKLAEKRWI